jgi:hypothetical protein
MNLLNTYLFRIFSRTANTFNLINGAKKHYNLISNSNSSYPFLVETKNDYVILKFNKPPVNSLSLETLSLVTKQFDSFEKDQQVKGVILTSVSSQFILIGFESIKYLSNYLLIERSGCFFCWC